MKEMIKMVASLTLIAAILGALLGWVHQITAEPISQAEAKATREALATVQPALANEAELSADEVTVPGDKRPVLIYPAYQNGKYSGAAAETWTMDGFSGEIRVMVGFDAEGKVLGYQILQSAETPGLGAKADAWFCEESEASADRATGASVKNRRSIIGTDHSLSVSKDGGEIDGITAATITSRAFLQAINRARAALEIYLKEKA